MAATKRAAELRRLPAAEREKARVLDVFTGFDADGGGEEEGRKVGRKSIRTW